MLEMNELSAVNEGSNGLRMDAMRGGGDLPQEEVGGGAGGRHEPSRHPPPATRHPPAAPRRKAPPRPGEQPPSGPTRSESEDGLRTWGPEAWEHGRGGPEGEPLSGAGHRPQRPGRSPRGVSENPPWWRVQMRWEKSPFDQLALMEELLHYGCPSSS
ncbi:EP300-interacting inhibitor of differentiation 1-like [Vulpes vulpes]|uniref:EP300-interacting inhibitor of differentiation 1-like n=1 Tax=Vulpes vulpes TaxID=9627 RepID=A0ABM4ZQ69_VULVU